MMSIFCWKQLKCFHVGQCLGQEKHNIFMKDTGAFSLIVLIQKWKEKRKTNIRKPLRFRLLTKFIFVRNEVHFIKMQNKTVALKEYLHKVPGVYHNNYLMKCLKLIYVDGNRSHIYQHQLSPWYITLSLQ